jgi:hypothetical protein
MSLGKRAAVAIAAGLVAATLASTGAGQAQAAQSFKYRDYLRPAVTGTLVGSRQIVTSGMEQCSKATTNRIGHWFCITSPAASTSRSAHEPVQPAATTTHCIGGSCWARYDDFHSSYSGSGAFGIGSKVVGTVDLYFDVQLSGSRNTDKPVRITPSVSIKNLVISGDRLYYSSAYPGGNEVAGGSQFKTYRVSSVSAGGTGQWASPGYVGYENTVAHGSTVHEWTWEKTGYSGSWYAYDKSIKFDRTVSGGTVIYRNGAASYLGSDPSNGGHTS